MRSITFIAFLFVLAISSGCSIHEPTAQEIIDQTIENAGGDLYTNSEITFDFRDRSYRVKRVGGLYEMSRYTYLSIDSTIEDHIYNYGYKRFLNDSMVSVPDSMSSRYASSVNSVIYFALLPFGLNDPSVNKKLMGEKTINDKAYYQIKVTFDQKGGGEDFQDQFIYWISKDSFTIDYLAYSYESDGGGMRFRVSYNPRYIEGIRFCDYINYAPDKSKQVVLENLDDLYLSGKLDEISRIETENISVSILEE